MRKMHGFVIVGLLLGTLLRSAGNTASRSSTYADHTYGFTLNAPQFPKSLPGKSVMLIAMAAPPEGGFASNVNVLVQQVATSRKEYRDLSVRQYRAAGQTVNSARDLTVSGKD